MVTNQIYNTNFRAAGMAPMVQPSFSAEQEAKAAADFERILRTPMAAEQPKRPAAPVEDSKFMSFIKGIIDVINPLQHIPVVSTLYRHVTGDTIDPIAHLAGDALYGGPVGAAVAVADITYQKVTGRDVGETVLAAVMNLKDNNSSDTMLAKNLDEKVTPAAGTQMAGNIIWDTPSTTDFRLSPTPTPHTPQGTNGNEPVPLYVPTRRAPVQTAKNELPSAPIPQNAVKADSTLGLHRKEAPAGMPRTDVPPELISAKMMEALDKYQQMKQAQASSTTYGIY